MKSIWYWMVWVGCTALLISLGLLMGTERLRPEALIPATGVQAASQPEASTLAVRAATADGLFQQPRGGVFAPATVGVEDTVGFLVKFGFVLLLLYGSLRVLRGFTLRWRGLTPSTAQIAVLETRYLSPRRALYLVRAGSRVLLLGGTDQQINFLADVTDSSFQEEAPDEGLVPSQRGNAAFPSPFERGAGGP